MKINRLLMLLGFGDQKNLWVGNMTESTELTFVIDEKGIIEEVISDVKTKNIRKSVF